jgi:hypothetical protein
VTIRLILHVPGLLVVELEERVKVEVEDVEVRRF